ncbi:LVIVD repeat-containing protein [Archangium primigenium]|uniref:LVIVD repeat-containing protein n=1 Tax=[Archangium] primigenium TaxID=2792470 RepID=UPI00195E2463|nr:hypothetical protein [Archangium primigenium]MBM7117237.1 hypothetical protein [Archangium primigenium]
MPNVPSPRRSLLAALLLSLGGGCSNSADDMLPAYRCVEVINGANESGGEIASVGTVAYVAGFATIAVFDLSDSRAPRKLAPLSMPARVESLAVANGRLVAATANTLHLFDASRPEAPVAMGELRGLPSLAPNALATDGRYAYVGTSTGLVLVFDLTSGTPVQVTALSSGGTLALTDLLLVGDVLYVAGGVKDSLVTLDVRERTRPVTQQPPLNVSGTVLGLTSANSALWAVSAHPEGARGLRMDTKTPLAPKLTASSAEVCACYVPFFAKQVTAAHGHLFAVDYGGTGVEVWKQGSLDKSTSNGLEASCFSATSALVNVHAVGETLVVTGGSFITFMAP